MMQTYPKAGNTSAANGYLIESDRIYVRFAGGLVYGYSYESAGMDNVEEMKRLAQDGEGLTRFIRKNVSRDFFFKGMESELPSDRKSREIKENGMAKMPAELRNFEFTAYPQNANPEAGHYPCQVGVTYAPEVAPEEKVPGLQEVIRMEAEQILRHMAGFFGTDNLPREFSIELSPLHVTQTNGTMTDGEIVNAISDLYRRKQNPNPDEVKSILSERMTSGDVTGTYHADHRLIKLYYRVWTVKNGQDYYLAEGRNTLAHEMLHMVHHFRAPDTFGGDSKEAVRVKEALADFYAFGYSLEKDFCIWQEPVFEKDIQVAKARHDSWVKRYGGSWPYAYAMAFWPEKDGAWIPFTENPDAYRVSRGKYMETFGCSQSSMPDAYAYMMR